MAAPHTPHSLQGASRLEGPHPRRGNAGRPQAHAARDGRSGAERARDRKIEELKRQAETTPKIG
jgi:hypothetical protein